MSNDICGNCGSFRPLSGQRFFNCTWARQAGLGYGMQVRPDTRACDRFSEVGGVLASPPPQIAAKPGIEGQEPTVAGLCTLGQKSLVIAVGFSILVITWLLYTCATV